MKKKERLEILGDLDKILDLSFKYCKHDNKKIGEAARAINDKAYTTMKYIDRYLLKTKKKVKKGRSTKSKK